MGTHFGGSIFAMTDPFFTAIFKMHLGRDIQVWDKSASIRFKRASKFELRAVFRVTAEQLAAVKSELAVRDRMDWTTAVEVTDSKGMLVALVDKTLAFRRR